MEQVVSENQEIIAEEESEVSISQQLADNNYVIVPNFISKERAQSLAKQFKEYCDVHELSEDPQVSGSIPKYDFKQFLQLLVEKNPQVSDIIGESVLPTYSYAREYKNGNVLDGHVDKPHCEISLTVNLDCDQIWPIWIYTPSGEKRFVDLHPGDAMLYLGMIGKHGRDAFEGESCTQVFLHYVRVNGPCFPYYFDKDHRYKEDRIKRTPSTISGENKFSEYIKVYDNIFTQDECEMILDEYRDCEDWASARVSANGTENRNIRNCDIISTSVPCILNKNKLHREMIDKMIHKRVGEAMQKYVSDFPNCFLQDDSGYDLLRYQKGGFYREHTDSFKENPRTVAMSINLNDDFKGGNMAFFNKEIKINASAGSVIMFPANFMYPHQIMDVTEGTRYSIITWLI